MSNLILGWPFFQDDSVSQTPTLSGGSWEATLPLTNLKDRRLSAVARSTDDALTSTIVKVDLGVARPIRIVAVPKHNLSTAAKARVRLFAALPATETNDFGAGAAVGTPIVTTGQTDPLGGTRATVIEDDDGTVQEARTTSVTFTGDGTKSIAISVKEGASPTSDVGLRDTTAAAWRHFLRITWSGGVPSLTTEQGAGTLYTPIQIDDDWWLIQFTAENVVAANANAIYTYPTTTGADTGTSFYYEAMAFDYDGQPIVEDSGVDDAWPSGLDAEEADGINIPFVHVLDDATSARYVRLEIADTANADEYVELARLIVAGGYEPAINMSYGAKLGLESDTIRTVTDGGAAVYQEKAVRRSAKFALEHIAEAEAFANAWQMQRRLGTSGQVFFIWDSEDSADEMAERSFLGVLRQLHGLDAPYPQRFAAQYEILEEL